MNSSNNSSLFRVIAFLPGKNVTFPNMDTFFTKFGSPKLIDTLYVGFFLPTCLAGIILNSLSILIFRKRGFNSGLFAYLRVSVYCGLCINLNQFLFVFVNCRNYFTYANSYWAQAYIVFIFTPAINFLVFYKFLIDLAIAFDRIAALSHKARSFYTMSPFSIQLIMLVFAFTIHIPYFFYFDVREIDILVFEYGSKHLVETYFLKYTDFNNSLVGKIVFSLIFLITHGLHLIVELILNTIIYILFKRHLSRKNKLMSLNTLALVNINTDGSANHSDGTNSQNITPKNFIDNKITWMCITLNLISGFHQILLNVFLILTVLSIDPEMASYFYFVTTYSNNLRNVVGFLAFYGFNKKFRRSLKILFQKIKDRLLFHL